MSEEKVIKHSEKAVHIMADKTKSWGGKIKEIALEIVIIVFAVSITLMMHNWNDERHEKQMEKEFLEGIRNDLQKDADNVKKSIDNLSPCLAFYDTIWSQIKTKKVDINYLDLGENKLYNTRYLGFNYSRFESFKSSGNLRLIENQDLLNSLSNLYIISLPFYQKADNIFFDKRRDKLVELYSKVGIDSSGEFKLSKNINNPEVQYFFYMYDISYKENIRHRKDLIDQILNLKMKIEKELKNL